jgi:hypothetical protein
MWQDAAGTVAVTADNDPVRRIDGQRGVLSLRAPSDAARPLYKTSGGLHWLQGNGSSMCLASAATLNLTGTDKITVCAGVRKTSDAASGIAVEASVDHALTIGSFVMAAPSVAGANSYRFVSTGAVPSAAGTGVFAAAPNTSVLTGLGNISGDSSILRRNGAVVETNLTDQGNTNYGNHTIYAMARNNTTSFLNGNIYFLLIRGAITSGAQLSSLEQFAARKTGITF